MIESIAIAGSSPIAVAIDYEAMDLGGRIIERMTALGISQSELARRVGVSQPTIHNLIHRSKRGSTHIHRVARELGTTPEYLMGETDDPGPEPENGLSLSPEEHRLLAIVRGMPPKDRAALKLLLERMQGDTHAE